MTYDIINIYQYGCQKFRRDLSNPAPSFKVVKKKNLNVKFENAKTKNFVKLEFQGATRPLF